jgi:hypothetical protein
MDKAQPSSKAFSKDKDAKTAKNGSKQTKPDV